MPDTDPALWVVKDADTTIYLFGTFHALDGKTDWFNDEVRAAFDRSSKVYLEIVKPEDQAAMLPLVQKYWLAKDGKLQPHQYQGGTASISNMGMYGIKQFDAVINPPQGMILAVGAGEKRPCVINDSLQIATVMSATGSFDHRAIDGADGAKLMQAFKRLVENPLGMLA